MAEGARGVGSCVMAALGGSPHVALTDCNESQQWHYGLVPFSARF